MWVSREQFLKLCKEIDEWSSTGRCPWKEVETINRRIKKVDANGGDRWSASDISVNREPELENAEESRLRPTKLRERVHFSRYMTRSDNTRKKSYHAVRIKKCLRHRTKKKIKKTKIDCFSLSSHYRYPTLFHDADFRLFAHKHVLLKFFDGNKCNFCMPERGRTAHWLTDGTYVELRDRGE